MANRPLWSALLPVFSDPAVNLIKVKGHSQNFYNELADALATDKLDKLKKIYYNGLERKKERN